MDKTKIDKFIEAVQAALDALKGSGTHTVKLGFRAEGSETMTLDLVNDGCDQAQVDRLRGVYDAAAAAGAAKAPGGEAFSSTLYVNVDGVQQTVTLGSEAQVAAAQVAALTTLLGIAQAQLAKFQ